VIRAAARRQLMQSPMAAAAKVARLHGKVRRQRLDHAHQTALTLVRAYGVIARPSNLKSRSLGAEESLTSPRSFVSIPIADLPSVM
jgi:hypothetical protein